MREMKSAKLEKPVVHEYEYWVFRDGSFEELQPQDINPDDRRYLYSYPVVYVVYCKELGQDRGNRAGDAETPSYAVYVGETNDIVSRSRQHLTTDAKNRDDWKAFALRIEKDKHSVKQFVIGHSHFNKSLTLDIENRMMQYLLGVDAVKQVNNRRANAQGLYYTHDELDRIFSAAWLELHRKNPVLFPSEAVIRDSAIFKASPFHQLTREQDVAEDRIIQAIDDARQSILQNGITDGEFGRLILVQGAAGTGKTVLISHLFNRLAQLVIEDGVVDGDADDIMKFGPDVEQDVVMLVRHNEQRHVYNQIAKKLGIQKSSDERVMKPSSFINKRSEKNPNSNRSDVTLPSRHIGVALVDEAHLLLTQGDQGYSGKNMLLDIMRRAAVTIAVFDPDQILQTAQRWEPDDLRALLDNHNEGMYSSVQLSSGVSIKRTSICLHGQFRIVASKEIVAWIEDFAAGKGIGPIALDSGEYADGELVRAPYEIKVFDSPVELFCAIKEKAESENSKGLSRVVATYDWPYKQNRENEDSKDALWNVELHKDASGSWAMGLAPDDPTGFVRDSEDSDSDRFCHPWNYQLVPLGGSELEQETAWAEKPETIYEIGSTYTIQGFDLNYVGVIIGPSVTYRDGRIVFDPSASENGKAKMRRGGVVDYSTENLCNELNVLLKRGVHGLYLFAVDKQLQEALLAAQRGAYMPMAD